MFRGLRFWLRTEAGEPDDFEEVLNAGWVPQLPGQAYDAAVQILETLGPALSSLPEAEVRELIARFYAYQSC